MSDATPILTERPRPGILLIRLNRPDELNAMNVDLIDALHEVLAEVRDDSTTRAIVLTGEGRAFCAGLDLRGYGIPQGATEGEGRAQLGLRVQKHIAGLVDAFRGARPPIIAAVNGAAAGGGMSLALMSDIRIVSESAVFHAAFIRRGLSNCDIGMSWLLPRMIGFSRAAQIMLTGRSIDASEAERIGLVSSVEPADKLLDVALDTAGAIAQNSPFGVWMTKEVMWSNLEAPSMRAAIDLENRTQILSSLTRDHKEAVVSFLEKRPPAFQNH
ncbi:MULTISPECIES: enoyl-CoA hydratase/isomerase family protein [unclassified Rhodococcus (in: high G+C Gram-positive bacteria)]|uniref:enoyl-CoA hydratase/isomerase family protein n=1 Tax=unclassified Rhodococcus (in: high G+C Gram-positive bacteria) TaxID=192944 RepID=UPI00092BE1C2|nr:enoyl-CoA hydratase-related protein [Rhodococcus sp. M8]OLL20839.1 enoyl-CoA hydratase [Rhodococcus sp. M8]QPG44686.1 enoyl-CoA hydratase/isomerase family protein [Rhodococcus sp. M8]